MIYIKLYYIILDNRTQLQIYPNLITKITTNINVPLNFENTSLNKIYLVLDEKLFALLNSCCIYYCMTKI